jgi:hypothetical protein
MIVKNLASCSVFFFVMLLAAPAAIAQPSLPDIAATADKGIVVLTWNCQYNAVKSISVLRSADSTGNFTLIGSVKKLDKGTQAFVDGQPGKGRIFYKLSIVFSSGLAWSSNRAGVLVEAQPAGSTSGILPSNDSLKQMVSRESNWQTKVQQNKVNGEPAKSQSVTDQPVVSFSEGTTNNAITQHRVIKFDDPDPDQPIFIKSKYVYTDAVTGHVNVTLTDDVKQHHYSIRFYDLQKRMVTEIPKVNTAIFILDKRNFPRKGVYKFVLRRDVVELENGYVVIP